MSAVSYTLCAGEIQEQLDDLGLATDGVYISSSGGTGAGMALGAKLLGWRVAPRLICPMPWPWAIPDALAADADQAATWMGLDCRLTPGEIDADERFIAPGYGRPSKAGQEALHALARTEAVLLDPVYSAKAMAGLVADVRAGRYPAGSALVFVHTGGAPAIFATPAHVLNSGE